jgi:hypothetical protein
MIELNLKLSPDTANHLLASLAGTINALGLLSQEIKRQGDAQMQPPQPEPEAEVLDKES